jgi:tight adherence protein C
MSASTLQLVVLRWGSIGLVAFAASSLTYTIARAPTREASRLGLRGLKRQRALASSESWAAVEPLVRWLGIRVSGLTTDDQRKALDHQIALAGDYLGMTPDEYVALSLLSSIAGLVVGLVAGSFFDMAGAMGVLGLILGGSVPYFTISGEAQERKKNVGRALPYVNDLLALAVGAGLDFPGAVRQVIEKSSNPDDPIIEELTLILQTINLGRTRRDALIEFSERVPAVSVIEFVNAIVQAEERGNPVAEVLAIQAATSRVRRSVRAEELAAKAGTQMIGPLMVIMACVLILLMGPLILTLQDTF